jgi:hypothetical protein
LAANGLDANAAKSFEARFADVANACRSENVRVFADSANVGILAIEAERSDFGTIKAGKCFGINNCCFITNSAIQLSSSMIAGETLADIKSTWITEIVKRVVTIRASDTRAVGILRIRDVVGNAEQADWAMIAGEAVRHVTGDAFLSD